MDVFSRAGSPELPQERRPRSRRHAVRGLHLVAVLFAFALGAVQKVHAVDIYYARAIGQEYLPTPVPATPPANSPGAPNGTKKQTLPDLPGLGTKAEEKEAPREMGMWTKVLIGVVVVGAIAALGNKGGDGGEVGASTGSAPPPPPPDTGGAGSNPGGGSGSGGGGSGGGGGIGIDVGIGIGGGN
jgi:hypothetical protein